ncbi:MAG: hypothetical protein Tsb006_8250 [Rickettsiaceae bacterium]
MGGKGRNVTPKRNITPKFNSKREDNATDAESSNSIQKVLSILPSNSFWEEEGVGEFLEGHNELLEQFLGPGTVDLIGEAAGGFDFAAS